MKLKEISVKKIIAGVKEHWNTPPEVSPKQPRRTGLLFGNSFASSSLADCIKKSRIPIELPQIVQTVQKST